MSNTSTSANLLKRTPFPSMTGFPARAPMSPNPNTAVAVAHDSDEVAFCSILVGIGRIGLNLQTRLRNAGRVRKR